MLPKLAWRPDRYAVDRRYGRHMGLPIISGLVFSVPIMLVKAVIGVRLCHPHISVRSYSGNHVRLAFRSNVLRYVEVV